MWKEIDNALHIELLFEDFTRAFAFMVEVAFIAEQLNHHPEWSNVYNKVNIKLTTHDAGSTITQKDRDMAELISKRYQKHAPKSPE